MLKLQCLPRARRPICLVAVALAAGLAMGTAVELLSLPVVTRPACRPMPGSILIGCWVAVMVAKHYAAWAYGSRGR